jgi:integrase
VSQRRNRRGGVEDRWKRADGTPSATHGKGKRWRGRYVDDTGREHAQGFDRKVDAQRWVDHASAGMVTGTYVQPRAGAITVGELGPDWLGRQTHLKPSAYRPVESAWRIHVQPRWDGVAIADIRHTAVQEWVSSLTRAGSGATTVIRAYGVLASMLDDAVKDRRLSTNPARGVNLPRKGKKQHIYLTHGQLQQLADAAGKYRTVVLTLGYCGLRWGEMAGLRVQDLDLLRRRLTVVRNAVAQNGYVAVGTPKSHHQRTVPVPGFLVTLLAQRCEGKDRGDLVFAAPMGGYMRQPNGTRGWFETAWRAAGVPRVTPHDLRHTAASLAVSAGANVKALQRMLGHASAAMTLDVYADLFDTDFEAVGVALDRAANFPADELRTRG